MTFEEVHAALVALNEARQQIIKETNGWEEATRHARIGQWNRIHELDAQVAVIEQAVPLFRVWYDAQEHDSYVLVPRKGLLF